MNGRRLWLVVRRRRLRCDCGRVFTQPLPSVAPRQWVSVTAQTAVQGREALLRQAPQRRLGSGYSRAQRWLLQLPLPWCAWEVVMGATGPIALGIDEHSFRGKDLVITITSLSAHRLVAILPDDRQATLRAWLRALPETLRARVVPDCTDLREADHFHLIQDATRPLDETRRLEQREAHTTLPRWSLVKAQERLTPKQQTPLTALQQRFPTLPEQYWRKEGLRQLSQCPDRAAAQLHFQHLVLNAEAGEDASTVLWARTPRRWDQAILGYWQHPISNGFTEGCHTKVKLLKRLSYGFRNVGAYRRKMLSGFLPRSFDTLAPHFLT